MIYQNRSRKLLSDFSWVGLIGGGLIALISTWVLGSTAPNAQLAAAAVWLVIGQALCAFGVLCLVGFLVAKSVAYDIRNAHLPEFVEKPHEPLARPDADPQSFA